jgi:hypothetical protein
MWRHSWRDAGGKMFCIAIEGVVPTETGSRGSIGANRRDGSVYFVLPENVDDLLAVGRRKLKDALKGEYGGLRLVRKRIDMMGSLY